MTHRTSPADPSRPLPPATPKGLHLRLCSLDNIMAHNGELLPFSIVHCSDAVTLGVTDPCNLCLCNSRTKDADDSKGLSVNRQHQLKRLRIINQRNRSRTTNSIGAEIVVQNQHLIHRWTLVFALSQARRRHRCHRPFVRHHVNRRFTSALICCVIYKAQVASETYHFNKAAVIDFTEKSSM
jgi:hypothetical protein